MGILSRFRDIMASNVNAWMSKTEDPEKAMDAYMRGLNSDLGQVKAETASVQMEERRAKRALDEARAEISKFQKYAEKSVQEGNEDQALRFLERKAAQAQKQPQLQAAYDLAQAKAERMGQMQEKLVADVGQLEARRAELKGKIAATKAQQRMNDMGSAAGAAGSSAFGALEAKVNQSYDEAVALAELRAEKTDDLDELFAELERQTKASNNNAAADPQDELTAMKAKINAKE